MCDYIDFIIFIVFNNLFKNINATIINHIKQSNLESIKCLIQFFKHYSLTEKFLAEIFLPRVHLDQLDTF